MKKTSTMKTKLLTSLGCLLLMAGLVHANAVLSFDDHGAGGGGPSDGTYTAGSSFTFDITLAVANSGTDPVPNVNSISLWFETAAVNNSYFKITNRDLTGGSFPDPQGSPSYPEAIVKGGNATDLGATLPPNQTLASNTSYLVEHLTIQIAANTPAGTYTIFTTTNSSNTDHSKTTAVGDGTFTRHEPASAAYTITVVPEPATLSLLGLSGLGSLGMTMLRRRRRS
jgi:PEP-CTERM motif